ncbi:MAG TPA: biopolymer transporter ExbD [Gammaproteobacteria bacterium]|nr:biopolymer transporter ExbD [Gammaproteobacteria bacterium]
MARRHAQTEEAEIDMTPMLDVTFILLIFFIVTTSFVKPTGINPSLPEAMTTQQLAQGNILIGITADDEIWMNKHHLQVVDVRTQVEQAKAQTPKSNVVIVADRNASTAQVVQVMDAARLGGAENVWIATTKGEQ